MLVIVGAGFLGSHLIQVRRRAVLFGSSRREVFVSPIIEYLKVH